jgi:DNA polymerase III subunit alpha, Gram-positive type
VLLDHSRAWWDYPIVIVDFETTGVDPLTCEPVSMGAIRLSHGEEIGRFYTLLKPTCPIPAEASAIHGITDDAVEDAPSLLECAQQLYELAEGAAPCAYNGTHYDKPIFHRYISGADCPLFEPAQRWIDPLVMIRAVDRYVAGSGRHKLSTACERWQVPMPEGEAHNALGDCRATGRLLVRMIELGKVRTHVTLGRLLDYTGQKALEQQADFDKYRAKLAEKLAREAEAAKQGELSFDELDDTKPTNSEGEPCQST